MRQPPVSDQESKGEWGTEAREGAGARWQGSWRALWVVICTGVLSPTGRCEAGWISGTRAAVGRVEGAWQLGGLGLGEKGTDVAGESLGLVNGLDVRSEEKR